MLDEEKYQESEWTDGQKTRLAIATIVGTLVKALDTEKPGLASRFKHLSLKAYAEKRDYLPADVLEAIKWAADVAGPQKYEDE